MKLNVFSKIDHKIIVQSDIRIADETCHELANKFNLIKSYAKEVKLCFEKSVSEKDIDYSYVHIFFLDKVNDFTQSDKIAIAYKNAMCFESFLWGIFVNSI